MTVRTCAVAVLVADPQNVVSVGRGEPENLSAECVRGGWCEELVPCSAGIGGVDDSLMVSDEICAFIGELVMVERKELDLRVDLVPSIAFVAGLPDGVVCEADKDGRRVLEIRVLQDGATERKLLVENFTLSRFGL